MRNNLLMLVGLLISVSLITACTTFGHGVDDPMALDTDYATRERAKMKAGDRCGPEFLTANMPSFIVSVIGPIIDGPFRPVCRRHDACYRLEEQTQAWCDARMKTEMAGICDKGGSTPTYSVPGIGRPLCQFQAGLYHSAIDSTSGASAYGEKGYNHVRGGEISAVRVSEPDNRNNMTVCVDVANTTQIMQEYDVEIRTETGKLLGREPDHHDRNIRAGTTDEFCVDTNLKPRSGGDTLAVKIHIALRADRPAHFSLFNDMSVIETRYVEITQ